MPAAHDNPAVDCRKAVLDRVVDAFKDADTRHRHAAPSVWSAARAFALGRAVCEPGIGMMEIAWSSPALRLSVGLRYGEVRIGFLFAHHSATDRLDVADLPERGETRVCTRPSETLTLVDYIFTDTRFARGDIYERACCGDKHASAILADSIFLEAHHLRSALVQWLFEQRNSQGRNSETAKKVTQAGSEDTIFIEVESSLDKLDVAMKAGVSPDHVVRMESDGPSGLPRYLIAVPKSSVRDVFSAMSEEPETLFIQT